MTYKLYNVPKYRTYHNLWSEGANTMHTGGIRTNTYNTVVGFQP